MKTAQSLLKSAKARLKHTGDAAEDVQHIIDMMRTQGICGQKLHSLRQATAKLTQASYEFNAYWNAYETN